jgi:ankyrin repeat protein/class 3 adenylate cyclase
MPANIFSHIRRGLYDNVYHCVVREKVDVNGRDEDTGNTPLVVAVMENQREIAQLLLNNGADVNLPDWTGKNTPLDLAEQSGFLPIAHLLQSRGGKYGSGSGFHLAAKNGDLAAVDAMLGQGQRINEVDAAQGWTPLHYAVHYGQKHLVEFLLVKGADVNARDFLGKAHPIDVLGSRNRGDIVRILRRHEAKPAGGLTIHFCAETGDFEGVQRFFDTDGRINGRDDKNGWMPIHYAVNANDIEMVEFLICLGANVNGADFKGELCPLDLAVRHGNVEMQALLQSKGAVRKRKYEGPSGSRDGSIQISEDLKRQMQAYIERRGREEARLKEIVEEEAAKNPRKKEKKVVNWKEFLRSKNKSVVEKKPGEEKKAAEVQKPVRKIVKRVEQVDVEVRSSRLELDVEQEGYIFFMDIVGYSKKTTDEQRKACKDLGVIVKGTVQFQTANALEKLIILPTGDGMVLGFFTYLEDALNCGVAVAKAVKNRPDLQMRMGVHCGPVIPMEDINGNLNISGDGINYAQRVMDAGESNHLLVSAAVMTRYERPSYVLVNDLGDVVVKHGVVLRLYSLHGADFGNREFPSSRVKKAEAPPDASPAA